MSKQQTSKEPLVPVAGPDVDLAGVSPIKAAKDTIDTMRMIADIDRVLEILAKLPLLKRYGGDGSAVEEARTLLEKVKDKL